MEKFLKLTNSNGKNQKFLNENNSDKEKLKFSQTTSLLQ